MSQRKKHRKKKKRPQPRRRHSKPLKSVSSLLSTDPLQALAEDVRRKGGIDDTVIRINPEDQEPLSDRLTEILGDFLMDRATDKKMMERLLFLAATAWNATVIPEDMQQEFINHTIGNLPEEIHEMVLALKERKLQLYPDDQRYIVDVRVDDLEDGFYISAASLIPPPEEAESKAETQRREEK